jgi:hypothetical protein
VSVMFETFTPEALAVLQTIDVPRVRASDYFSKPEGAGEEAEALADDELSRWDAYLSQFARLTEAQCLCCGTPLRCAFGLGLLGGFEWGLAHGEGHCSRCRYPMRGHHRVDGLGTIRNLFLAYHPSTLSFSGSTKETL